jgi:hypothetical protein
MTARRPLRALGLLSALAVLALSAALAACGTSITNDLDVTEGQPVQLGDLQYNVLFSRFLNPYDIEDRQYLVGQAIPAADQLYLGVFVQVLNKSKDRATVVPSGWTVVDTEHTRYQPLPSQSPDALALGKPIGPEDQAPALDSPAQSGPIEGSLVLFLITEGATQNRPLELLIPGPGGPAKVTLDI